jgi:hypothetical protein
MQSRVSLPLIAIIAAYFASGCNIPESRVTSGIIASDEPRVWVVRVIHKKDQTVSEVYRCADGAEPNQPPRPVCVKAPMADQ